MGRPQQGVVGSPWLVPQNQRSFREECFYYKIKTIFSVAIDSGYLKILYFRERFGKESTWKNTKIRTILENFFLQCACANFNSTEKRCECKEFSLILERVSWRVQHWVLILEGPFLPLCLLCSTMLLRWKQVTICMR